LQGSGGDELRRTQVAPRLQSPIAHFIPSHPRISPLTAGRDRPYAFVPAAVLVSQGLTIDFTGSDEVNRTELHGNPDYDASRWWRFSEGVREVLSKEVAYLYAEFLLWPVTN
jgi:hypothetical protein